jgi:hypothetical protein
MFCKFDNIVIEDNKGWFAGSNVNGVFCYDFQTKEVERVAIFEKEEKRSLHLYCGMAQVGELLIFIPNTAKYISSYNVKTNEIAYYEVPNTQEQARMYGGYYYGDSVYMAKMWSRNLYRLDLKKNHVEEIDVFGKIEDTLPDNMAYFWNAHYCTDKCDIYLNIMDSDIIVKYNLKNGISKLYRVGTEPIYDMAFWEGDIWITTVNGTIVRWNSEVDEKFSYKEVENNDIYPIRKYRIFIEKDTVQIMGVYKNNDSLDICMKDNTVSRKSKKLFEGLPIINDEQWEKNYIIVIIGNEIFVQCKTGEFCKTNSFDTSNYEPPVNVDVNKYILGEGNLFYENYWFGINEFWGMERENNVHEKDNVGSRIFKYV